MMPEDHTLPPPDATCDGGDLDCGSGLLLIIRSAMAPLPPGGVLLVKSREISVREDLPAWCRMVGHGLLAEQPADGGYTHYLLRKKQEDAALAADLQKAREHVWQTRVRWTAGMHAKALVRNHSVLVGQPASFDTEDEAPSAIELLLAAVGGALATGLQWRLSQQGLEVRNLEVVVKARSANSLVFLGVEADGNPALEAIEVAIYIDCDAERPVLESTLHETMHRCPVTQSLLRSVHVTAQLRTI
ncbi:MAG TPA: OsmC family protein [Planctomycetota bacterium]|nr:OsmC family protein [Planctomycetota bacterium]